MSAPLGQVQKPTETATEMESEVATARRSRLPNWFAILWANRKSRLGLVLLAVFVLVAVFAPLIAPHDPKSTGFEQSLPPSADHLMGTTASGQDIWSQLVHGARTSLIVGVVAGLLVTLIALLVGLVAGYMQGWVDEVLSFLINLALVVPVLPLMITLAAYSPVRGLGLIILVISITGWAWGARVKRAQILTLRARDYITAARFAGESTIRIVFAEIMPNMMSLVVAGFLGAAGGAIGAEAGLEFLGLGDPTTISWGTMLYWANNNGAMLTGQWLWLGAPGLAIALLLTSLTLINFGVDALSNPHLRER
ncbi:ABC transporter permease [Actinopolymorpha pittospori]|uniref:Peptide/nickel transport system permease protein n=1 Tax=Actinopolymorpha pittospori TaxID=648752 RepID=A0A927N2V0_9ACTN|nr:ABC transporter permease [Actinopolymorpha pittospori]MBE1607917.1 peptide/nickel transport system permease protein [Actinopolymorpha pittospori]